MFVLGNLCQAVAVILDKVLYLYGAIMFIAILITWVRPDPFNPIVQFLRAATEPVFDWIRRRLPFTVVGMIDLSPIVAMAGLWFLRLFLVQTLMDLSLRFR